MKDGSAASTFGSVLDEGEYMADREIQAAREGLTATVSSTPPAVPKPTPLHFGYWTVFAWLWNPSMPKFTCVKLLTASAIVSSLALLGLLVIQIGDRCDVWPANQHLVAPTPGYLMDPRTGDTWIMQNGQWTIRPGPQR